MPRTRLLPDACGGGRATPLRALARGLVAGAAGTAAMDLLLHARARRAGGAPDGLLAWETSAGLASPALD